MLLTDTSLCINCIYSPTQSLTNGCDWSSATLCPTDSTSELQVQPEREEFEDQVEFLKRMQRECRNVLSLLNTKETKLLAKSPTDLYDKNVNEEYLCDMAASLSIKQKIDNSHQTLRQSLLTPQVKTEEIDVENFKKQTETLKLVCSNYLVCKNIFRSHMGGTLGNPPLPLQ